MADKKIVVVRDSRNGHFVPHEQAKTRPNTTETERYSRHPDKKKK